MHRQVIEDAYYVAGARFPPSTVGLLGAFWKKVWALGAKVWDPTLRVQEP